MNTIEYLARCHCGALTARYRTAIAPVEWAVRACQCSFCRSHGAIATSDPEGLLEFRSSDPNRVQRYRRSELRRHHSPALRRYGSVGNTPSTSKWSEKNRSSSKARTSFSSPGRPSTSA
jgi:hypothetical protein